MLWVNAKVPAVVLWVEGSPPVVERDRVCVEEGVRIGTWHLGPFSPALSLANPGFWGWFLRGLTLSFLPV